MSSLKELIQLCDTHDIIFLQETWLLAHELSMLQNIHDNFIGYGMSAVDTTENILVGRPFGGTAVLYRKTLRNVIKPIKTECWRINALLLYSSVGPVLCCNVYICLLIMVLLRALLTMQMYALSSLFCLTTLMPPFCWLRAILIVMWIQGSMTCSLISA